jgi:hypothetical protein
MGKEERRNEQKGKKRKEGGEKGWRGEELIRKWFI